MTDRESSGTSIDLLVVGAGPTGISIGAEARRAGLDALLVDRGPVVANLLDFPTYMTFFTTRDRLEIADVPFAVPEDKPDRRQAVTYYHSVARRYGLRFALHEEVREVRPVRGGFEVASVREGESLSRRARAVALATGYFHNPRRLGVAGEEQSWVHSRFREPYGHFEQEVVVVGGGNSAAEAALDLWRAGARVTLVHRGAAVKASIKYWLRPDIDNRIAEGSVAARFGSRVTAFRPGGVEIAGPGGTELLPAATAYVLIGYLPDAELQRRCGVEVDPETLVPAFTAETCESNVQGLYIAGTLQAGARTDRVFIENSRDHGQRIARHLAGVLSAAG